MRDSEKTRIGGKNTEKRISGWAWRSQTVEEELSAIRVHLVDVIEAVSLRGIRRGKYHHEKHRNHHDHAWGVTRRPQRAAARDRSPRRRDRGPTATLRGWLTAAVHMETSPDQERHSINEWSQRESHRAPIAWGRTSTGHRRREAEAAIDVSALKARSVSLGEIGGKTRGRGWNRDEPRVLGLACRVGRANARRVRAGHGRDVFLQSRQGRWNFRRSSRRSHAPGMIPRCA